MTISVVVSPTPPDVVAVGSDGKSAYQVAVDNGFVGTQAEWLASLNGDLTPEAQAASEAAVEAGAIASFAITETQAARDAAQLSSTASAASAASADAKATEATASAAVATTKAGEAATSATAAGASAAAASTQAGVAATKADEASASASASASSASASSASASSASASAAVATTKAGEAATSATAAGASAAAASTQAGAAATSATAAANSASAASGSSAAAASSASAAAISASTAESAAGPTYASIALGEAATTTGQSFAVDNGDGTVSVRLRTVGGSTLQRTLATTAALAADGGAAMVGYKASGAGSVARSLSAKLADAGVSVLDFIPVAEHAAIRAGSSSYDCRAGIQAAIDHAIYGGGKARVHLPAGVYKCAGELHLGYGISYASVVLEGDGTKYAASSAFNGSAIVFTHNNAPGISVQGARGSVIRNLTIQGVNRAYLVAAGNGTAGGPVTDLVAANWVDPALPAASSLGFSVYAGVAIDPRSGPRPATSYPDVSYPVPYVGTPAQYGKVYSSNVLLENVEIEGFVVGVVNQPCDADGNADYLKMKRVMIAFCQYGVSICNSQARLTHFQDGQISFVHTAFVTTKHGRQSGKPAFLVDSCEFGAIIKWVDMPNLSWGGSPRFVSCYGEQIYSIGNGGANAVGCSTIAFESCEFAFELQNQRGVPKYIYSNDGTGMVSFRDCSFGGKSGTQHHAFGGLAASYSFSGCSVVNNATDLYEKFALNATSGITTSRLGGNFAQFTVATGYRWNLDTGVSQADTEVISDNNTGARSVGLPIASRFARARQSNVAPLPVPRSFVLFQLGKASITFTTSGRDVTFDTGYSGAQWAMKQRGLCVGDVIWDDATQATFYVKSRTGGTITMRAMTGYDAAGELLTPMSSVGALYTLNSRIYTPNFPLWVDTTSGSAVLSNVTDGNGAAAFLTTNIAVGDMIYYQAWSDNIAAENGSEITAFDTTAKTITVQFGVTRTDTFRRVPLLIRAEAPNA